LNNYFLGCENPYQDAKTVLFGAPFDGTTTFRPGARFAPDIMRRESWGLETYSPYQNKDLADLPLHDMGDLDLPFGNPQKVLDIIEAHVLQIIGDGKTPFMLGGEHLVTLGSFRAVHKHHPDLRVIHFDAHTDLRDSYLGEKLSHACVIRRIHDIIGDGKIHQFGIRSGERHEFDFAEKHCLINKFNLSAVPAAVEKLKPHPIYLTIDLDVLDPSAFPGTGTPEPGGIIFNDFLASILQLSSLQIVACDVVELSPPYDPSGISAAAACKIVRELLLLLYC
jgi:agmatinase